MTSRWRLILTLVLICSFHMASAQVVNLTGNWTGTATLTGSDFTPGTYQASAAITQTSTKMTVTVVFMLSDIDMFTETGVISGTSISINAEGISATGTISSNGMSGTGSSLFNSWSGSFTVSGTHMSGSATGSDGTLTWSMDNDSSTVAITSQESPGQSNPSEPQIAVCQGCRGDPVNTAFGSLSERFDDFFIPGRGMALNFSHTYNSVFAAVKTPLGFGWTHSYNMHLVDKGARVIISQEDGSQVTFSLSGTSYTAPQRVIATLVKNSDGTFLFARQAQHFFTFSSGGKLISERDRNGYTTTLAYNGSGQLSIVSDPAGRTLSFTYNVPSGSLASVTDPIGRKVQFGYDSAGQLTTVTDVNGGTTAFTYSSNHLLLTMTDPRSGVVTNTYDSSRRVISQTDQLSRKTTFSYSPGTTTITDPMGNVTQEKYNKLAQRITLTRGLGTSTPATWRFTYDPWTYGISSVTDPNGQVSRSTYDTAANPVTNTDTLGRVTSRTWDAMNDLTSVTDPMGVTTTLTYDANGNLLTRSRPLTRSTLVQTFSNKYGDSAHPGDVTGVVDPNGKTTNFAYDANGNRVTATDPLGHISKFSYNGIGWLTSSTDANGKTTSYTYNNFGDLANTNDPLGHKVTRAYDASRNLISLTDANGHVTSFTYDSANERTTTTRANGTALQAVYNADGTLAKAVNAAGNATGYGYDALARLVSVSDPLGRTTSYTYDGVGNQLTLTDFSGQVTSKIYDSANEVVMVFYSDGQTPTVTMSYDADGQRTSMNDGTGNSTWVYDSLHRIISTTTGAGATVKYSYDLKGQLTKLTYPGGAHTVSRGYDAGGRLTSITDWLGNKTVFSYDPDGNLTAETLPTTTGLRARFSYDAASRLIGIGDAKGTTNLASFAYTRNPSGLLTGATEIGVPSPGTDTYGYTALDQLASVNAAAYSYDAADNVTGLSVPSQITLNYDAADELKTLTAGTQTTTFSYDTRGNRLSRTPPSGSATVYAYDQANRMVAFGTNATYVFDSEGLRMSKTVSSSTEAFTWDRSGTLPLLIADGTTNYVYGPDGLPLEQVSGSGTPLFYLHDQLGSTRLIVDNAGAVQNSYTYDAYGNIMVKTENVANPFGYAGQFTDSESGLIYLRARYYDPATAQFLNRDPIGNRWMLFNNPYRYARHSPINFLDPLGLFEIFGYSLPPLTFSVGGEGTVVHGGGFTVASGVYLHFGNDVPGDVDFGSYQSFGPQLGSNYGCAVNVGINIGGLNGSFGGTSYGGGGKFLGGVAVYGNRNGGGPSFSIGPSGGSSGGAITTSTHSFLDPLYQMLGPLMDYRNFQDPLMR